MKFSKVLAKYYYRWEQDCIKSAEFCDSKGDTQEANAYRESAIKYRELIETNRELIEFFSVGDRAFLKDSALPEKFRNVD